MVLHNKSNREVGKIGGRVSLYMDVYGCHPYNMSPREILVNGDNLLRLPNMDLFQNKS